MVLNQIGCENGFTEGAGEGLGLIFKYLIKSYKDEIFKRMQHDICFALGLGKGLGCMFFYLEPELQKQILIRGDEVENFFSKGLGEGLGLIIKTLPKEECERIFEKARRNESFAVGLGRSLRFSLFFI